jgi:outer membrane lipoprotein SlyB
MSYHTTRASLLRRSALATLLTASVILQGCAQVSQVTQNPRATYIAASDQCSPFREPFVQIREQQREQIARWAALGAVAGAGAGTVIGAANRDKLSTGQRLALVIGSTLAGAALGAIAGYYSDLQKRSGQTQGFQQAIYNDADAAASSTDRLTRAVADLNRCRLDSADQIAARYIGQGTAGREAALRELAQVRASIAADNELINSTLDGIGNTKDVYVGALKRDPVADGDRVLATTQTYRPRIVPASFTAAPVAVLQQQDFEPPAVDIGSFAPFEPEPVAVAPFAPAPTVSVVPAPAPAPAPIATVPVPAPVEITTIPAEPVATVPVTPAPVPVPAPVAAAPAPAPVVAPAPNTTVRSTAPVPDAPVVASGTPDRTNGNARLRSGPNKNAAILTVMPTGSSVERFDTVSGWTQVSYNGQRGFVANWLLGERPASAPKTVRRASAGIQLDLSGRPAVGNGVARLDAGEKEVAAMSSAHIETANAHLDDIEALFFDDVPQ